MGAHLFVLEATTNGYAANSKSLMSATSTPSNVKFPVTLDTVTTSPTYGMYYVTTDGIGAFSVSGDYSCDTGSPVYLYASGGTTGNASTISITGIVAVGSAGVYTYTFTAANTLTSGQTVTLSGLSGAFTPLNNSTQTVTAASDTGFTIATGTAPGSGSLTNQTGTGTAVVPNPAIVNLAMLGICSSAKNFSNLSFVFMNEISTVAVAYGMAGFGTDGLHIGSSTTNVVGLTNATNNTANLYDITGASLGSGSNGEGHIARSVTIAQNGTVPQAELDTLGNILANCVDSTNSAVSPAPACTGTNSSGTMGLFTAATSNGTSTGTAPVDTATAAFNIAHNPGTPNVVSLATTPPKTAPFQPSLSGVPLDFTVAITYNNIATPGGIAIDSSGRPFIPTNGTSGGVTKLSATGAVLNTSTVTGVNFDSIAIDPFNYVWVVANNNGGAGSLYEYDNSLGAVLYSPFGSGILQSPSGVASDSAGKIYVTDGGNGNQSIQQFARAGSVSYSINNVCLTHVSTVALDPSLYVWGTAGSNSICRVNSTNSSSANGFNITGSLSAPTNFGIDGNGNGWVGAGGSQTNLLKVTPTGGTTAYGVVNGLAVGGLASPTWVAIDGGNNVWITNNGNSYGLSEFNNAGTPLTYSAGYQGTVLNKPSFLAIDQSGDVWVPNNGNSTVTELIGAGVPTAQPLSLLTYGVKP